VAWTSVGIIQPGRRLASGGVRPRGDPDGEAGEHWARSRRGCVSGDRWGAGVVRAATGGARGLCERHWLRSAGKNRVAVSGGARGEAGQATRRGCEAQRGPLGHCGEGVC
jgi:hypothetical protein